MSDDNPYQQVDADLRAAAAQYKRYLDVDGASLEPARFRLRRVIAACTRAGESPEAGRRLAIGLNLMGNLDELLGYRGEALTCWTTAATHARGISAELEISLKSKISNWFTVPRVFVSYARLDRRRVKTLVQHLKQRGAEVIWDDVFIPGIPLNPAMHWALGHVTEPAGHDPEAFIQGLVGEAFRVAGLILVVWSKNFAGRPYTSYELRLANEMVEEQRLAGRSGPRVIVLRLDDEPLPTLPRDTLWIGARRTTDRVKRDLERAVFSTSLLSPRLWPSP